MSKTSVKKRIRKPMAAPTDMMLAMSKYFDTKNQNNLPPIGSREELMCRAWWALRASGFSVEIARYISVMEGLIKQEQADGTDQLTPERAVQIILQQNTLVIQGGEDKCPRQLLLDQNSDITAENKSEPV